MTEEKKEYIAPEMKVVELEHSTALMYNSIPVELIDR